MSIEFERKFKELQENPSFIEEVSMAKTASEFIAIYKNFGVELSEEEATNIVKALDIESEDEHDQELTMEQMDQVSGGLMIAGVVIPAVLWKTALALVAACGVIGGIKKLKKQFAQYF